MASAMTDAEKKAKKAAYDREYRAKNAEKIKAAKKLWGQSDVKKAYDKKWVEEHRERSNAIKKAWKERNPEYEKARYEVTGEHKRAYNRERHARKAEELCKKTAEWRKANPDRARQAVRDHYRANRAEYIARARARKTKLSLATPKWADTQKIAEIYQEAGALGMHVDHIIPLNGKLVTGLHVPENLQLLSPEENMRKGNRYAG